MVRNSRSNLGKPKSHRMIKAQRICLGCGVMFTSSWIGNRRCAGCKKVAAFGHPLGEDGIKISQSRIYTPAR